MKVRNINRWWPNIVETTDVSRFRMICVNVKTGSERERKGNSPVQLLVIDEIILGRVNFGTGGGMTVLINKKLKRREN